MILALIESRLLWGDLIVHYNISTTGLWWGRKIENLSNKWLLQCKNISRLLTQPLKTQRFLKSSLRTKRISSKSSQKMMKERMLSLLYLIKKNLLTKHLLKRRKTRINSNSKLKKSLLLQKMNKNKKLPYLKTKNNLMIKLNRVKGRNLTKSFKRKLMKMERRLKDKKKNNKHFKKENKIKLMKRVLMNNLKMLIVMVNLYKIL